MIRSSWILPLLSLAALALASCEPTAPPPASETVRHLQVQDEVRVNRRIRVDGMVDTREWVQPDTIPVLLPDGRTIVVLWQQGPESLDFAFLGLGGPAPKPVHAEILLDVSGRFPPQFGRESWWFKLAPSRCVARASIEEIECGVLLEGFEASPPPRERQDNLEVRIGISLLEFDPSTVPQVAFALRFSDEQEFVAASWPPMAELRRPNTWAVLDLTN